MFNLSEYTEIGHLKAYVYSLALTHGWRVAADEEDRDGDEDDAQLVLLPLLLEEPDLRAADQREEEEGVVRRRRLSGCGSRVQLILLRRLLLLFEWCITFIIINIKVVNVQASDSLALSPLPSLLLFPALLHLLPWKGRGRQNLTKKKRRGKEATWTTTKVPPAIHLP